MIIQRSVYVPMYMINRPFREDMEVLTKVADHTDECPFQLPIWPVEGSKKDLGLS